MSVCATDTRQRSRGEKYEKKERVFWNGIEGLDYGFITGVCREQKVAEQVDYVLLSIKVAPEFPRAWRCISIGDD